MAEVAADANANARRYVGLLESVACDQCGSRDTDIVHPARYERARPDESLGSYRASGDEVLVDRVVRCRRCGLQYLDPRVRQDLVLSAYESGTDEAFISQARAREVTFAAYVPVIERLLGRRGRVLDVGTAGGSFLAVARDRGWEVLGCEPNRWLGAWAKDHYGLDIVPGTLDDMRLPDASSDVAALWDVLEHTPSPTAVLRECRRVVKEGGLIVVNVPDSNSLVARLMGRRWVFLLSVHLYYFTTDTLTRMLRSSGFEVVRVRPHWQRLELGYIATRMAAYVPLLARPLAAALRALRLDGITVPYWLGQTNVIARATRAAGPPSR